MKQKFLKLALAALTIGFMGSCQEIYDSIEQLEERINGYQNKIQAVSIVPQYSDGSVKLEADTLYLDCKIEPSATVENLVKGNFTVLVNKVMKKLEKKAVGVQSIAIEKDDWFSKDIENGIVSLKVPVKDYIPADADSTITVAINVKNDLSNLTTEFVPVYTKPIPDGALPGKFTVNSEGKQVYFSQGNLQATYNLSTSTYTWDFAANQYNCIGNAAGNTTIDEQTDGAVVDLFGWSTSTSGTETTDNYGIKTSKASADYSGDFYDWGKAVGDGNTWRTLSTAEWQYLFNYGDYKSDVRNGKNKWATVNGVNGYVIAPDDFSGELADTYADDAALAADNLVFLPAAGYRGGSNVNDVGGYCFYWSSTALGSDYAYRVSFNSSLVIPYDNDNRYPGFSVRLVTDSK